MTTIAWYPGYQPSFSGVLDKCNSGSQAGEQEVFVAAGFIEGTQYGVIDVVYEATPEPTTVPGDLFGEYLTADNTLRFTFPGFGAFDEKPSGTWNIRVSVDGIFASGQLVLTTTNYGYGYYSDISWGWKPTDPEPAEPFWTRLILTDQEFSL